MVCYIYEERLAGDILFILYILKYLNGYFNKICMVFLQNYKKGLRIFSIQIIIKRNSLKTKQMEQEEIFS